VTVARVLRGAIAAQALALIALLAYTTLSRLGFPYELEWLEGWTVRSVRRVVEGQGLFVAPSVDWVPYTYTPLYTYLSAAVARVVGVGFLAPRLVSLAASAGALALAFALVRRETASVACGLSAAGFLAGTYPLSGSWFDIGRVDNLFLFFMLAGIWLVRVEPTRARLAAAGVMWALAYLSKQTALLPLAAVCVYAFSELRGGARFVVPAVSGAIMVAVTLLLSALTDGWYFFYTFTVQSLHGLGQRHLLSGFWLRDLGWTMVPAGLLGALFLARRFRDRAGPPSAFVFYGTLTLAMLGAAWISRLHGGGWLNVLQPAHAALALLFGLAVGEIGALASRTRGAAMLYLVAMLQLGRLAFDPSRHIPERKHVEEGDRLVAALRGLEGEVYTPMHGHIGTLAGKREFAHDGYLLTVLQSLHAPVIEPLLAEFREAFKRRRFAAVVVDYDDYRFMDLVRENYRPAAELPGRFRPRRGPPGARQWLYLRRGDNDSSSASFSSPESNPPVARPSSTRR
jgi:hypothetical protein